MLAYARFRGAGGFLAARREAEQGVLYRSAPLPPELRRAPLEQAEQAYDPAVLGQALGGLLRTPPPIDLAPHRGAARVARRAARRAARAAAARDVLVRRGGPRRRPDDGRGHAVRAARALQARRGRAGSRSESFGPVTVRAGHGAAAGARRSRDRQRELEALLFLAPDPVPVDELADALRASEEEVEAGCARSPRRSTGRGIVLRELAGGWTLALAPGRRGGRAAAARAPAHARAHAGAGRDALDRRLPAAGLPPRGRAHPRRRVGVGGVGAGRARADRGGRPLAVRRGAVPDHAAVPQAVRAEVGRRAARPGAVGPEPGGPGGAARPAAARRRGSGPSRPRAVAG